MQVEQLLVAMSAVLKLLKKNEILGKLMLVIKTKRTFSSKVGKALTPTFDLDFNIDPIKEVKEIGALIVSKAYGKLVD